MVLALTADQLLYAESRVGIFRIEGVRPDDLAEEIALLDIGDQYHRWRRGEAVACRTSDLDELLPQHAQVWKGRATAGWFVTSGSNLFEEWLAKALGTERASAVSPFHFRRQGRSAKNGGVQISALGYVQTSAAD